MEKLKSKPFKTEVTYACKFMTFADGRTIRAEDFDPKKDLTEEQNAKIVEVFSSVLKNT